MDKQMVELEYPSSQQHLDWYAEWQQQGQSKFSLEQYGHYLARKVVAWNTAKLSADLAKATAQGMLKAAEICDALPDRQYNFPLTAEENNRELARDSAKQECAEAIRAEAAKLTPTPLPETAKENEA
jgi:hypothetical protein